MKKVMKFTAVLTLAATIVFTALYFAFKSGVFLTLAISFGTTAYHFIMRLLVGLAYDVSMKNRADYNKRWYQVGKTEKKLYKLLGVKNWKGNMPTYEASYFDPTKHSWDEIAQATCQAELVHETIVVLSFLPIIATVWFGDLLVFLITSILGAAFDLIFVIMQRFNRPRIVRLCKRK